MPCAGGNQKSEYKYVGSPWTRQVCCAPSPYPIRFSIELRLSRAYDQILVMNELLYLTLFLFHSYFFCSTHSSISKLLCFLFFMRELHSRSFAIFSNEYLEPQDAASLSILISLAADGNGNGNIIGNSGLGMMAAWEASVRSLINQSRNNSSTAHATWRGREQRM